MNQREDETTREFAQRLVDAGEPNRTVEFSISLTASTILTAVEGMPEGTTPQEAIRARLLMATMQGEIEELSVASVTDELDDIEDQLEDLVGVVAAGVECEDYDADVSLNSESDNEPG